MHRLGLLHCSFALAVLAAAPPAAAQRTVDEYIKKAMKESEIPGLSLAVLKNGKIIKAAGYGVSDLETGVPATTQTVYKAASISKQFIAAAVMLLAQDGKLSLDDSAAKYLASAPESWKGITIRRLLTHTSGLTRDPTDYEPYRERPIADVIQSAYSLPLVFQPGERFQYSNLGYYILAEIISKASGKPWNIFIAERLFAPAGMTSTRLTSTTDIVPHRASGYKPTDTGGMIRGEEWIAVRPSGAFLSTVLDLAKWDAFLDGKSPLTGASLREMWTPVTLASGAKADYGFGWYVNSYFGRARIHHDGQYPGFRADFERFPDDKLSVIVLTNNEYARVETLTLKIAGYYAKTLETPPFSLTAQADGAPASGNPMTLRVIAKDGGKAAPESILEVEIWDESDNSVFKEHRSNESFAAGEAKTYTFTWTPAKAGRYTVSISAFGPKWNPPYAFNPRSLVINVN
jgi:CubicO group peptidase (beta-lactamase class C family)